MLSRSQVTALSSKGGLTIHKVTSEDAANDDAVKVTLYRDSDGTAYGWYIAPLSIEPGSITMPYLPKSARTMAAIAVVRAVLVAEQSGSAVCLIDPENLWDLAWRA